MAPVQAQDASSRDLRVRQTLELQRVMEKKEEVRASTAVSPRSKSLIAGLTAVLEPYNYGEAEIHNLVKRCGYDDGRIQAAVSNILEDNRGHEHEGWSTTATASEKKLKAQEAKERRLQREREQAEEAERQRVQRTKAADMKMRRTMEENEKRRSNDADRGVQATARSGGRGWGGWRQAAQESAQVGDDGEEVNEAQGPEEGKPDEELPADPGEDSIAQQNMTQQHMEGLVQGNAAQTPQSQWGVTAMLPETGGIWSSQPLASGVWEPAMGGEAVAAGTSMVGPGPPQASSPWQTTWLADPADVWNHGHGGLGGVLQVPTVPVPPAAGTWVPRAVPPATGPAEAPSVHLSPLASEESKDFGADLNGPAVVIPPSYAALLGPGQPVVMFGSLNVSEGLPKADTATSAHASQQAAVNVDAAPTASKGPLREKVVPERDREREKEREREGNRETEALPRKARSGARGTPDKAWAPTLKAWEPRNNETQAGSDLGEGAKPPRGTGGKGRGGRGNRADAAATSGVAATETSPGGGSPSEGGAQNGHRRETGSAEDAKGDGKGGEGKGRHSKKGSGRAGGRKGAGKQYWTERKQGASGK